MSDYDNNRDYDDSRYNPDDPFWDLRDDSEIAKDPAEEIMDQLADHFGVDSLDGIFINEPGDNPAGLRGTRFDNPVDAIIAMYERGILQFGNVYPDEDTTAIYVDADTP